MKEFREQELNSVPYFDSLNSSVLAMLPAPPKGIQTIEQGSGGILSPTNEHGRTLLVQYSATAYGIVSSEQVANLYQNSLTKGGWALLTDRSSADGIRVMTYARHTSCVRIDILPEVRAYHLQLRYNVAIWQDFLAQDFSPHLPPRDLLEWHDFGETNILACPPR